MATPPGVTLIYNNYRTIMRERGQPVNKFLDILSTEAPKPLVLGWFHLMWIGILIIAIALTARFLRRTTEKQNKWILFTFSLICIIFEVLKQLIYSYHGGEGWSYQWYAFPFQFCSTPMYVGIIAAFLSDSKVRRAMYGFLAIYGMFGGLCIYLYPEQVFNTDYLFVQIQTMLYHGILFLMGLYLIVSDRIKNKKEFLSGGFSVFLLLVLLAEIFNIIAQYTGIADISNFNMFYISPYKITTLPALPAVQSFSFVLFLLVYLLAFILFSHMVFYVVYGLKKRDISFKKKSV